MILSNDRICSVSVNNLDKSIHTAELVLKMLLHLKIARAVSFSVKINPREFHVFTD